MRWSGIILGLVFATHAFAQQIQSTEADLRKKNRDFLFEAAEQTTPTLRAYIRENGSAYTSVSNLGAIFYFSSNATDEVGMAVTNTSSGLDYLEWTLTSDQTAVPGEYFAQIIVTNTTGSIQEWIRGEFDILDSPGTTAVNSWAWNSSNYATVAWVEAQIAAVEASITGMVERSVFDATNAITIAALEVLSTGKVSIAAWQGSNLVLQAGITANADAIGVLQTAKVDITSWQSSNAVLQAGIDAAQGMATMGGDVSGPSTNAAVVKIRSVPVSELLPGLEEDGYGLKYDHATGSLLLGPVATEGTSISNILILSDVAASTDVSISEVGAYRILRPGNLPSMVLNVGGYETAYFDLLGLTLKAGSLHLLSDVLAVNPAAYDGSVTAPAYTWGDDRDLGKYRFSYNGDYAEGFTVQSNRVWYWAADGIHLESGKQFFGLDYSWLANTPDEADPLAIHKSSTYTTWTNAGGTYTQEAVFATSPLLTNGFASISYDSSGWSCIVESSADSNTWTTADATNGAVYLRLSATNNAPPEVTSLIISNIIVSSWTRPDLWGDTADTAGQTVLVDNPVAARQVVNKQTMDAAVGAVTPAAWSQYPATTNVNISGHRLIMTDEWTITQTGGVGIISYADISATTNELTIAHNGVAVLTAASGVTGLHIDDFSIVGSNVTLWVSTNGVVSEPLPQYTANLLTPDWQTIGSYTSTYPTVTNDAYKVDFVLPSGDSGFFRAVQLSGTGVVNVNADLQVQGAYPWKAQTSTNDAPTLITPRWVGDELAIYGATQVIYRAFGITTNDWSQTWP